MGNYSKSLEDSFGIKDKVVVVTGGTGAIGGEICEGLALQGARVVLLATTKARAVSKALELTGLTGTLVYGYGINITDIDDTRAVFTRITEEVGPIWGLVCAAGLTHEEYLSTMAIEDWQKVMDVNVKGIVICNKIAGEFMAKNGGGRIVNISSLSASHGKPQFTAYTPSKCAEDGFSWTLAAEWGRKNITVNSVWPIGAFYSRMNMYKDASVWMGGQKGPLQAPFYPRQLSGIIAFLLSESGRYISGQVIDCQGCMHHTEISDEYSPEDPENPGHGMSERRA